MAYLTDYQYYTNSETLPEDKNLGSYQYVSLHDVVNNFMLMYVGEDELINKIDRFKVLFHAKRGIQELNYDAMKETKIIELSVCDNLSVILPPDFVSFVRISLYKNNELRPMVENEDTNFATGYLQDNKCNVLFDAEGNVLTGTSLFDHDRFDGVQKTKYLGDGQQHGNYGYYVDSNWYFNYPVGHRFGLNTSTANANPTFKINKRDGVINLDSTMAGEDVILEYVSDGMEKGDDDSIVVNKLFEEYLYNYILYAVLSTKRDTPEYIVRRFKNKRRALLNNAKIRMTNLDPRALLMPLRGRDKHIK
jgi:hypothetical protein